MLNFLPKIFSNDSIFGLDIGYETLKLVEIKKIKNKASLVGCIEVPLSERILERDSFRSKEKTANLIKEACRKAKPNSIKASKIVSALPETFVFSKTIQMPKMSQKEYEKAVPLEAAQYLPIPLEQVYIDFDVLIDHPEESLSDILIVASPRKLVDDYVEMSRLAGFELAALETKSIAVGRAISFLSKIEGSVVVEIGTELSRISIWENGRIRLATTASVGKNQIIENLKAIGCSEETSSITENLFPELSQTLMVISDEVLSAIKYHQSRDYQPKPIQRILLCGSGATIKGIEKYIKNETKLDTQIIEPKVMNPNTAIGTEFITAFGLALREE